MNSLIILRVLTALRLIITLLSNFVVNAKTPTSTANLAEEAKNCEDQLDLLQDSLTLSKGDENETPDDPQRTNSQDSTG